MSKLLNGLIGKFLKNESMSTPNEMQFLAISVDLLEELASPSFPTNKVTHSENIREFVKRLQEIQKTSI